MKAVCIKKINKTENGYEVYLGNGFRFSFSSERACNAFLAETNRFLTQTLHSLNSVYADIYSVYRDNWAYFYEPKNTFKLFQAEQSCKQNLQFADNAFDDAIKLASHPSNGNFWPFAKFYKSIDFMREAVFVLKELNAKKSNGATVYKCADFLSRLATLKVQLDTYGQLQARGTIPLYGQSELVKSELNVSNVKRTVKLPKIKKQA